MTEERRRLAALALLWALFPLPFVGVVLAPFWMAGLAAAAFVLARGQRGFIRLSTRTQNIAGVLILVLVAAAGGVRVGPLRPLGHLLVLLAAIRVIQVQDRRSFRLALALAGMIWVAAVASSHHVALVPYLFFSAVAMWWGGMRVLLLDRAEEAGADSRSIAGLPLPRLAVVAALLAVLLMTPVFVLVPRLRSPVIGSLGVAGRVSGFSSAVELGGIGRIKDSRRVALVVEADRVPPRGLKLRLRGTVFDLIRTGLWRARRGGLEPLPLREGLQWLGGTTESLAGTVEVSVELLRPRRYLFVPEGAVAVRCSQPLSRDRGGGVVVPRSTRTPIEAVFFVKPGAKARWGRPTDRDRMVQVRDARLEPLARRLTDGLSTPDEKAMALTRYLQSNCGYSLESDAPLGADPVAWFLFEGRKGHCEFFAGSLAVLLRLVDVPARMVGGYLPDRIRGGSSRLLVRESQAHTWVEVWLGPRRGWKIFDPTPSEGVPGGGSGTVSWVRAAWDEVELVWDRWILTFGLGDQIAVLESALTWAGERARALGQTLAGAAGLAFLLWLGIRRARHRRNCLQAGPAARRLKVFERRLARVGAAPGPAATPRDIALAAAARWPEVADSVLGLAVAAEWELYGPDEGCPTHWRPARSGPRGARKAPTMTSTT